MTKKKNHRTEEYSSTREAFDDLHVDEKAFFLLESTAKAVIDCVEDAVETLSSIVTDAFAEAKEEVKKRTGTASEPTANKKAGAEKASTKKAATKKAATKKAATEKKAPAGKGTSKQAAPKKKTAKKAEPKKTPGAKKTGPNSTD